MHLIIQNLEVKIYVVQKFKMHKIKTKSHCNMFRIVCDPSSGSIEQYLTEIRSGSLMFVLCLVGVWQRNFEPVVFVCTVRRAAPYTHTHTHPHTHHWFKITLPNTDQAHDKHH